jgi:pyruvate/2-oxoglutarate dehydrogenase complex dihydrolipoamide dehydrogenase (E3) component
MPTQSLKSVPDHVLILGGGYVGLEFAQAMRRFGSRVTIVERNERLLHREGEEVSEAIMRIFIAERIELVTGGRLKEVDGRTGEQITPIWSSDPKSNCDFAQKAVICRHKRNKAAMPAATATYCWPRAAVPAR